MPEREWRKENLLALLVEMYIAAATTGNNMEVIQKTKNRVAIESSNPTISTGIYPDITIIWKDTCTPMFIAALFTIVKTEKVLKYLSRDE